MIPVDHQMTKILGTLMGLDSFTANELRFVAERVQAVYLDATAEIPIEDSLAPHEIHLGPARDRHADAVASFMLSNHSPTLRANGRAFHEDAIFLKEYFVARLLKPPKFTKINIGPLLPRLDYLDIGRKLYPVGGYPADWALLSNNRELYVTADQMQARWGLKLNTDTITVRLLEAALSRLWQPINFGIVYGNGPYAQPIGGQPLDTFYTEVMLRSSFLYNIIMACCCDAKMHLDEAELSGRLAALRRRYGEPKAR